MDWGWIVLIVVLVLLALPLFVPLIVRVRATSETREFEYAVALGPFALLPDLGENLGRYKRAIGRPLYYITRPIVWLFKLIVILLRILTWPIRALLRLRRGKRAATPHEPPHDEPAPKQIAHETKPSEDEPESTVFRFDGDAGGDDATRRDEDTPEPSASEEPSAGPSATPSDWDREDDLFGDEDAGAEWTERGGDTSSDESKGTGKQKKGWTGLPKIPVRAMITKARDGLAKARDLYTKYGRTGKRVLRAMMLFGKECLQALSFRTFQLHWSTGGDPAALGQILGWHYTLTGVLDPRVQKHVHFDPDWNSEQLAPSGTAHVILYIWPYRFIPPVMRLLFRMPWWGLIRVAREQILKRS
ncbi:hypothetical protein KQI52_14150 [bacterium]|nr:hypothetical protein [bacterium]